MIILDIESTVSVTRDDPRYAALATEAARRQSRKGGPQSCEEFQALCPLLARPVAIAMWSTATERGQVAYDVTLLGAGLPVPEGWAGVPWGGERPLLEWAHQTLDAFGRVMVSCGFNSLRYDLPLLWHRARIHGVTTALHLADAFAQKPWDARHHIDLAAASLRDNYSLRTYALAYGLDDPKAEGTGADIERLILEEPGAVLRYVCGDVRATAQLAERLGFALPAVPDPRPTQFALLPRDA